MLTEAKVVAVTPDTNLEHLLEQAENNVLILERNGVRYRLTKEESAVEASGKTRADYEAFLAAAGSWADVDVDAFIEDVYASRRSSSRPRVDL